MILKHTHAGAMIEANRLAYETGRRYRVRKAELAGAPGTWRLWWVVEPAKPVLNVSAWRKALREISKRMSRPVGQADVTLVGP